MKRDSVGIPNIRGYAEKGSDGHVKEQMYTEQIIFTKSDAMFFMMK